jgi:hypothetical protein
MNETVKIDMEIFRKNVLPLTRLATGIGYEGKIFLVKSVFVFVTIINNVCLGKTAL